MLRVLEYGGARDAAFRPFPVEALGAIVDAAQKAPLVWIDAPEASEAEIGALAEAFSWHSLIVEDVTKRGQRQKVEQFPGTVFAVLYAPRPGSDGEIAFSEIHAVQTELVLVTVHEGETAFFDGLATILAHRPDIVQNGAMSAATVALAGLVDGYELAIDAIEERVQRQESEALDPSGDDPVPALRRAAATRTAVAQVRRAAGQLREVVGVFVRRELINVQHSAELDLELRDVHDHAVRAHDDLDMLHDRMSALADTRLAMVAYAQNEITKRLSAYGAILIVPAIVTGWFGQNFQHMIGLSWRLGEVYALLVIGLLCSGMWLALRRARWL